MKIKKYLAKSMPEAMQQIRKELGYDAVILQSKEIKKGGILGLFKNKQIEVVAALDPTPPEHTEKTQESTPALSNQKPIPQANDQKVLKEIQYLKESNVNAITTKKNMKRALENLLDNKLENAIGGTFDDHKQIIQFVGPTGVGKTTTLAKVAAKTILEQKKEVAFITMDTYRIAAI